MKKINNIQLNQGFQDAFDRIFANRPQLSPQNRSQIHLPSDTVKLSQELNLVENNPYRRHIKNLEYKREISSAVLKRGLD